MQIIWAHSKAGSGRKIFDAGADLGPFLGIDGRDTVEVFIQDSRIVILSKDKTFDESVPRVEAQLSNVWPDW